MQIVALDPEMDYEMRTPAVSRHYLTMICQNGMKSIFKYLDWIIDEADHRGLYVLLLTCLGPLVVEKIGAARPFDKIVNEDNAYEYGDWIGRPIKDRGNIVWCLGGDRQPIHKGLVIEMYGAGWRRGSAMA